MRQFCLLSSNWNLTGQSSFEYVEYWNNKIYRSASTAIKRILVGNKLDLTTKRVISYDDGANLATKLDIPDFIETSAKTGEYVDDAVLLLTKQILNHAELNKIRETHPCRLNVVMPYNISC